MNFVKRINVTQLSRVHGARFASWYKSMFKVEQNEPPYSHIVQVGDPGKRLEMNLIAKYHNFFDFSVKKSC